MVPHDFPSASGGLPVEVHAAMYPAGEVGGDLYDVFEVTPGVICVAVGDVSGKGVPAALFMARTRSVLRAATLQFVRIAGRVPSSAEVLDMLNAELCKDNADCMFVTLLLGFLDLASGRLGFTNAGHVRPYVMRMNGAVERLDHIPDQPLGVAPEASFTDMT